MTIYIEYVILDNLVMDYIILNFIEMTYKRRFKKVCKFLSCLTGALLTLVLPYIYNNLLILNLYRMAIAIIIVLMLKKYKNVKQYLTYLILFISYTFLLGGVSFGIISMFNIDYTMSGVLFYSFEFPISLFILIFYFAIKLFKRLVKVAKKDIDLSSHLYPIKIFAEDKCVEGVGLYDSGNRLEVDGDSISIISMAMFLKLYEDMPIEKILLRDISNLKLRGAKYIDIQGLSYNGSYLSFNIDKILIGNNKYTDVRVAVTLNNFNKFDCILNSNFICE